ncbi:CHAT domain-containing protein [Neolewinella lacunae]|uniref:CHAT domain-containing protein n=1 Tax=Neolewinella lacunae TaxID=1517758 RepID=A0A923PLS7_9BACT|nr:CHAT domain-containing protein [Neolewinella lacunae]MBC6993543.1 CHAT domain-containing protein [Neolewinella lacunae]MDN3636181.1 CHAT domain-containing protein [Neolewinella lacunae]
MPELEAHLRQLTLDGELRTVVDFLRAQEDHYRTDSKFQNNVGQVMSQLRDIEEDEIGQTEEEETIQLRRRRLGQSILTLLSVHRRSIATMVAPLPVAPPRTVLPAPRPPTPTSGTNAADAHEVLFIASNPRDVGRLQKEKEFAQIQQELGESRDLFRLRMAESLRRETLTKKLLEVKPAIVHFCAHGTAEVPGFHPAGIVLEDLDRNPDVVSGEILAGIFKLLLRKFSIRLVFLNCCLSTEQARQISANGIYAIGMAEEIPDNVAISFAAGVYCGLADDETDIEFAFAMGLNALHVAEVGEAGIPKLFKDGQVVAG